MNPRRKDINPDIYVGEPNHEGWCKWKPIEQLGNEEFVHILDTFEIEKNDALIEYFSSYYFLTVRAKFKSYNITLSAIAPGDGFKRLLAMLDGYRDSKTGKIKYIPIGSESGRGYSVVVEVKTGIVKFADDETGKTRKISSSLEEFIKGLEPIII